MMRKCLALVLTVTAATTLAFGEDGWEVKLGAGIYQSPVYDGAGEYYVSPVPSVDVAYNKGAWSLSASLLDGLGATYFNQDRGLIAGIGVRPGSERSSEGYSVLFGDRDHTKETQQLLRDTPDVRGIVCTDVTLGVVTPVGLLGVIAGYRPIESEGTSHGFVGSLFYWAGAPLGEHLEVGLTASLEAMDPSYADAWYSVSDATGDLDEFDAQAGLRSAVVALETTAHFTERFGLSFVAGGTTFLSDARRSPYTQDSFETVVLLRAFYSFL